MRITVTFKNELTNATETKIFASEQQARSYIIGAVHGKTVACGYPISVKELQKQLKTRLGLRLGFETWILGWN